MRRRRRRICGLARVYASSTLALGGEGFGTLLRDDLEVVGATGVCDVDGWRRPVAEDDGPLLLSHGDVLGVVVPVVAEGIELALKFVGDEEDEGVGGRRMVVPGAEESEGFGLEECLDFVLDVGSDMNGVGHCVVIRMSWECL